MIKKSLFTIALLSSLILQAEDIITAKHSNNRGLLGTSNIKVYVGKTSFGDKKTAYLFDDNIQYGVEGSFKANEHISLGASIEIFNADININGVTGNISDTIFYFEGLYHFLPDKIIDPFITLGLVHIPYDVEVVYQGTTIYKEENLDNGYIFTVGAEFDISERVFLTPSFSYSKVGTYDANSAIVIELDTMITNTIYIGAKINMDIKNTDTSYYVGVGFKFTSSIKRRLL